MLESIEEVVTAFCGQVVEQEMSVDGPEVRDAANTDSLSGDSRNRKRTTDRSDSNLPHSNVGGLGNESSEAKRQKTDSTGDRKPNTDPWDAMFLRLAAYKVEKGHCLVPKRYALDPKLGTWVETQRVQYKRLQREFDESNGVEQVQPNKRLDHARLEKLNSIGFAWSAKTQRKSSPLPDSSSSQENTTVPQQKRQLGKPGFDEKVPSARHVARNIILEAHWNEMYERLVKYKDEHGDTLVPRKYDKDSRLAAWVEQQRVSWNRDFRETVEGTSEAKAGADLDSFQGNDSSPSNQAIYGAYEEDMSFPDAPGITFELYNTLEKVDGEGNVVDHMTQACVGAANKKDSGSHLSAERKEKLDKLGFVWSLRTKRNEDHWDDMFRQLVEYKNVHGDCLVPSRYEENLKLGKWVESQRYEATKLLRVSTDSTGTSETKRGTNPRLTDERRRRLESIGFEWKVRNKMKRYYDKQWDQMFDRLLEFKAKQGHCLVPKRYPDDMKLAGWVHTQRIQHRKLLEGHTTQPLHRNSDTASQFSDKSEDEANFRLTDERRQRLSDIGFVWNVREAERIYEPSRIVRTSYDDQWDAMFNVLKSYKEKYGDCLVPKRYTENPKLGCWVDTQRSLHKKLKKKIDGEGGVEGAVGKAGGGRLTQERIRRLEDLGFVWSLRDDWQKHYDELKEFKKENDHCNVPARYAKNRRLGIWVSAQRQQYKLLQKLPFFEKKTDSLGDAWNQKVRELKDFREIYGHCNVPMFYHNNPELRSWIDLQRNLFWQYRVYNRDENGEGSGSEAPYSDEKIRILEEMGFDWADRVNHASETSTGIDALQKASSLASAQLGDSGTSSDEHLRDTCYGV